MPVAKSGAFENSIDENQMHVLCNLILDRNCSLVLSNLCDRDASMLQGIVFAVVKKISRF